LRIGLYGKAYGYIGASTKRQPRSEAGTQSLRAYPRKKTLLREGRRAADGRYILTVLTKAPPSSWPGPRPRLLLLGDEVLLSLAESDPEAFATLYDRHSRAAYALAYRMMGERLAAEDLVQEVFLKVWRTAGSYRAKRGTVRTWILSIVRNRAIDQLRADAARRRSQEKIEASAPRSHPSEAFTEAWRTSRQEQLHQALKALPPEQSKILVSAYLSGYTHVEIAGLLKIPLGTVKGRIRLGLKKVWEHFARGDAAMLG
jgi:RNA polymerase sigma-70 factor, ECF subfamily